MRDKPMIQRSMRIGVDDIVSVRVVCKKCKSFTEQRVGDTEANTSHPLVCANPLCNATLRGVNETGPLKQFVTAMRHLKSNDLFDVEICFDVRD